MNRPADRSSLRAMSRLKVNQDRARQRWRSTQLALRLSQRRIEETKRMLEEARKLLDRPVYPYDPRTVPKPDK